MLKCGAVRGDSDCCIYDRLSVCVTRWQLHRLKLSSDSAQTEQRVMCLNCLIIHRRVQLVRLLTGGFIFWVGRPICEPSQYFDSSCYLEVHNKTSMGCAILLGLRTMTRIFPILLETATSMITAITLPIRAQTSYERTLLCHELHEFLILNKRFNGVHGARLRMHRSLRVLHRWR